MVERVGMLVVICTLLGAGACTPHGVELELDDPLEPDEASIAERVDLRDRDSSLEEDLELSSLEPSRGNPDADPCAAGRQDARTHIAANTLMFEVYGYPASCRSSYARILEDRYGVTLNVVSGCVVNSWILDHARCYNDTMEAEIARRHGPRALAGVLKDAGCD